MFSPIRKIALILLAALFFSTPASAVIQFDNTPTNNDCAVSVLPVGSSDWFIPPAGATVLNGTTALIFIYPPIGLTSWYLMIGDAHFQPWDVCTFNACNPFTITLTCIVRPVAGGEPKTQVFTLEKVDPKDMQRIIDEGITKKKPPKSLER